jgi:hypothetical protein
MPEQVQSSPIKRGTARRLGLRPPMSAAMYCFGREMSDDQMEQMREIMNRHARKAMGITEETDRG